MLLKIKKKLGLYFKSFSYKDLEYFFEISPLELDR